MTRALLSISFIAVLPACSVAHELDDRAQEQAHCVLSDLPRTTVHAPEPRAGANFGSLVAIDGDVLVVSAGGERVGPSTFEEGAVYIFEREGADWMPVARLTREGYPFVYGTSLAVHGDMIIIGGIQEFDIVTRTAGAWALAGHFTNHAVYDANLALTADRLILGATVDDLGIAYGEAFSYPRGGATIGDPIAIDIGLPNGCKGCPSFGQAVVAEGDLVGISAPGRGYSEVHMFRGGPTSLIHEATLERPATRAKTTPLGFGTTLSLSGDRLFVGDPYTRDGDGAVSVFVREDGTWHEEAYVPGGGDTNNSFSLALAGTTRQLLVGAPFRGGWHGGGNPDGEVRLFTRDDYQSWQETAVILDSTPGSMFGGVIAMQGSLGVIGAPSADNYKGAVYLYDLSGDPGARCNR